MHGKINEIEPAYKNMESTKASSSFLLIFVLFLSVGFLQGCDPNTRQQPKYTTKPILPQTSDEPLLEPDFHPDANIRESIGNIHFDRTIPTDEYTMIAKDLHALRSMIFDSPSSSEMRRVMKLPDSSTTSVISWLEDRIQYILDHKYGTRVDPFDISGAFADNYGTGSFIEHLLYRRVGVAREFIPGIGDVFVTSPRIGMVRIGPIFYSQFKSTLAPISMSIIRLGILFHEARHSDGNGASLGFFHHNCPPGHAEFGKPHCDHNENGPHTIEGLFLKAAMDSCRTCSTHGKEVIRLYIASAFNRVIRGTGEWDDTPQGTR